MSNAEAALIVRIPVEVLDPTWTDTDLQNNAAMFLDAIIERAEAAGLHRPHPPYRLRPDVTVWTESNFAADLAELQ